MLDLPHFRGGHIRDVGTGPYPERDDKAVSWFDEKLSETYGRLAAWLRPAGMGLRLHCDRVEAESRNLATIGSHRMRELADALRPQLLRHGFTSTLTAKAFALAREAAARHLGLRHYPVQLIGGRILLDGALAEMDTGEGKTLTALLPAVAMGLAGQPVHVITVNEYLAGRDAEQLRPVYEALGLSVGLVRHGQSAEERKTAYRRDICYCTNKDIVFDYLRDRIALGQRRSRSRMLVEEMLASTKPRTLLLRGLHFAIVDEADSVLIDEARTPLILSSAPEGSDQSNLYDTALEFAKSLCAGDDFTIDTDQRSLRLTAEGQRRALALAGDTGGIWAARRARTELLEQALTALHFYRRDQHYLVAEGKVQIIDEFTGRVMPDRVWERGLHQMIEAREGCEITGARRTLARLTYQRFFRRYHRLAGMTGTAREAAGELWAVYGLHTKRVPTNRPSQRRDSGTRVYESSEGKWRAIVDLVKEKTQMGNRPVLVGTRSVAASEHLSRLLAEAELDHVVLNARQDKQEADIVAAAGLSGRITVATNMAGRGTDIRLSPQARAAGGLHVVLTEFHESRRIDRQLFGRSARQDDPGSYEAVVALDDELIERFTQPVWRHVSAPFARDGGRVPGAISAALRTSAQRSAERRNSKMRRQTVAHDRKLEKGLAFAGRSE